MSDQAKKTSELLEANSIAVNDRILVIKDANLSSKSTRSITGNNLLNSLLANLVTVNTVAIINASISSINTAIEAINTSITSISSNIGSINTAIEAINTSIDDLNATIEVGLSQEVVIGAVTLVFANGILTEVNEE